MPGTTVYQGNGDYTGAGWHEHTVAPEYLSLINKSGYTEVEFRVLDPGPDVQNYAIWNLLTFDGGSAPSIYIEWDD